MLVNPDFFKKLPRACSVLFSLRIIVMKTIKIMRYLTILTILTFTLFGCFKDTENTTEVIIKPVPSVTIGAANVVVKVQDEFGRPISGLTARFNKITKVVENASIFHFTGENIYKENELLTLTTAQGKSFEFNLYNVENQINYHQITLFSQSKHSAFSSRETHVLPLPSNSFELKFVPQVYHTGALDYAGEVQTQYMDYDITNPIHRQALPGGNILLDNGIKKIMQVTKAFYINLSTPDEKSLTWNLPQKGVFTQEFPAGSYLLFYEKESHQWKIISAIDQKKEIEIAASGTYIVAELANYHVVNGTWLVDNNPLLGHGIEITSPGFSTNLHTTNTGYWEAVVPANQNVSIKALFACPSTVQTVVQTIGEKTATGTRNFSAPDITFIEAQGNLLDCDHQPLQEGFLLFQGTNGDKALYFEENQFQIKLPVCASENYTFSAKRGNVSSTKLNVLQNSLSLGNVYVCEDLTEQYVALKTMDGYSNLFQSIQFADDGQVMTLEMNNAPLQFYIKMKHAGMEGIVPNENANIIWRDPNFVNKGIEIECPSSTSCGFENIELTQYSEDQWIRGSFTGRFWTKTFDPLTAKYQNVHVDFQVKKQ